MFASEYASCILISLRALSGVPVVLDSKLQHLPLPGRRGRPSLYDQHRRRLPSPDVASLPLRSLKGGHKPPRKCSPRRLEREAIAPHTLSLDMRLAWAETILLWRAPLQGCTSRRYGRDLTLVFIIATCLASRFLSLASRDFRATLGDFLISLRPTRAGRSSLQRTTESRRLPPLPQPMLRRFRRRTSGTGPRRPPRPSFCRGRLLSRSRQVEEKGQIQFKPPELRVPRLSSTDFLRIWASIFFGKMRP